MKKNKTILSIIFLIIFMLIISACSSSPIAGYGESYTLTELFPPTPDGGNTDGLSGTRLVQGRVVQVDMVHGTQKYIYISLSNSEDQVEVGHIGDIFADSSLGKKLGSFKVIQISYEYYKAEITDLIYLIERNAIIQIEVNS